MPYYDEWPPEGDSYIRDYSNDDWSSPSGKAPVTDNPTESATTGSKKHYLENGTSFSGTDIDVAFTYTYADDAPKSNSVPVYKIGNAQTVTVSEHSDLSLVRSLGRTTPSGFIEGPSTIAGSVILTVMTNSMLLHLINDISDEEGTSPSRFTRLPLLNILFSMRNEYGQSMSAALIGVRFIDTGTIYSIEDIKTEMTLSYLALDYIPMCASAAFRRPTPAVAKNESDNTLLEAALAGLRRKERNQETLTEMNERKRYFPSVGGGSGSSSSRVLGS